MHLTDKKKLKEQRFMGEREWGEHRHQNNSIAKYLSNCIQIPSHVLYIVKAVILSKSFSIQYVRLFLLKYDDNTLIESSNRSLAFNDSRQ